MAKNPELEFQYLLAITRGVAQAKQQDEFLEGLRRGFTQLHRQLTLSANPDRTLKVLETALRSSVATPREKQILEICSWPIFDKPALPVTPGALPEFLWIFAVPIVVQFASSALTTPIQLGCNAFDASALTDAIYQSGCVNPRGVIHALPTLFSGDDLQREGPASLATQFVRHELGLSPADLVPRSIQLDPELEAARLVTFYALASARLPVGERFLMVADSFWGLCSRYVLMSCLPSADMTKYSGFRSPLYHSSSLVQAR